MQSRFPNIRPVVTEWLLFRSDQLRCLPYTEEDLRSAISDVLKAVSAFHTTGHRDFHRDIRWPNVLRGRSGWVLADFELADRSGQPVPPDAIATDFRQNPSGGRPYSFPGDIYRVGRLLDAWQHARGRCGIFLGAAYWFERLAASDPAARPTGQALLVGRGAWLQTARGGGCRCCLRLRAVAKT